LYLRGLPLGMVFFAHCCIILQKFLSILCALSSLYVGIVLKKFKIS